MSENVPMCMVCNNVEQKVVVDRLGDLVTFVGDHIWFDVIANHAHLGVLAYTKRKLSIASVTPEPLWALDPSKAAPLSCVVLGPILHDRPTWMFQNVKPLSLSAPGWEGFDS